MNLAITILKDKLVDLEDYLKVLEAQKQNTKGIDRSISQITEALDNLTSSSRIIESHFTFAEYLKNYTWIDNTSKGDIYKYNKKRYTQKEIYERWLDSL